MLKKLLVFVLGGLSIAGVAFAAPTSQIFRTLLPETNNTYDLGSSTDKWRTIYVGSCVGCSSAGSGTVGTSSAETSGRVPFWTTTGATTALLSGGSSGFSWDNTLSRLTATNLSVTLSTTTSATSTNSFSTNATSTNLFSTRGVFTAASSTSFAVTGVTSALHLADGNGSVTAYGGVTCTNQFLRALSATGASTCATIGSADVSLANLSATDGTLTFSGTYTGATARTIGINLGSTINVWTASTTFAFLSAGLSTTTSATSTNIFSTKAVFTSATTTNDASTNNTITNATTTNLFSTTASSTNLFTSALGVASSTPSFKVSVNGAINVAEATPATSTSMTVDWSTGNQQLIKIGTSATTIGFSNAIAGAHMTIVLCTPPSGTAGAVTFTGVLWPGGTAPTTTTTAKKCDIITLLSTFATTTGPQILGGYNQNY